MPRKRNKTKKQSKPVNGNTNPFGLVKEALTLIGGLAGSILAVYGLVKTFKDDAAGFSWLIPVGIIIWLIILWKLFQNRRVAAYSLFIISMLLGVVGWIGWQSQVKTTKDKVVVLVAQFDGPENEYGLRDEMIEQLRETTKGYNDTEIIATDEMVTVALGSEYARKLGEKYKADLVIWAWYKPTEDPNITIHIENLDKTQIEILKESEIYQPEATLADLKSFEIQRKVGSETSTLVSFLTGLFLYESGDYQTAIERFNNVLRVKDTSTYIDLETLYLKIGSSYYYLGQYEQSTKILNTAIALNPNSIDAYNNRGLDYAYLRQYDLAIKDFNKTIELDKSFGTGYYNLGFVYQFSGQYEEAIPYFTKAIELDSKDFAAYTNRATSYRIVKKYQEALNDYDIAIKLQPNWAIIYANRGENFSAMGQYELAIKDFNRAIELAPTWAAIYKDRGNTYKMLGKTAEAEVDFKKYEELTGQKP